MQKSPGVSSKTEIWFLLSHFEEVWLLLEKGNDRKYFAGKMGKRPTSSNMAG